MVKFMAEASLPGWQYMSNKKFTFLERFVWIIILIFLICITVVVVKNLGHQIYGHPTITTLDRRDFPTKDIEFPGVAICNLNKISKRKAGALAAKIARITNTSEEVVFKYVGMLGRLFDYNVDDQSEFMEAQLVLEQYYNSSMRLYTPYFMLRELETTCDELLTECYWLNQKYNCTDIFQYRLTYDGFCCIFNYVAKPEWDVKGFKIDDPLKVTKVGLDFGLRMMINNDPEDYLYAFSPPVGVKVLIFNPKDFPDITSGGLAETYAPMGYEVFLELDTYTIYTMPSVMKYSLEKRQCVFQDELSTWYGDYSLSNCLVHCRAENMLALCDCVPFQIPTPDHQPTCSLRDVPCLHKHKTKWNTLRPTDGSIEELDAEIQDALKCGDCYNSCSETRYQIGTSLMPVIDNNISTIRIYFKSRLSYLYKQDVYYYWYEILSNIGGLISLFLGCSLITLVEFIYFFMTWFVEYVSRRISSK